MWPYYGYSPIKFLKASGTPLLVRSFVQPIRDRESGPENLN